MMFPALRKPIFATSWMPSASGGRDRRTTILKVYGDLEQGRLISECEAVEQSHFEDWLNLVGWPASSINRVDIVCQVGTFWKL